MSRNRDATPVGEAIASRADLEGDAVMFAAGQEAGGRVAWPRRWKDGTTGGIEGAR
jgi:hypothetical protein